LSQPTSYLPYGVEQTSTLNGQVKFGTYLRDGNSSTLGLDYADQRYYNPWFGRFNSPDPSTGVDPADPGSWNKYAYVGGDPVNRYDPYGLAWYAPDPLPPATNPFQSGFSGGAGHGNGQLQGNDPSSRYPSEAGGPNRLAAGLAEMAAATQALRAQASTAVADLGEGCAGVFNDPSRNIGSVSLQQALSYNAGDATYVNAFGNSGTLTLSQTGYVDPVSGKPFAGDPSVQQYVNPAATAATGGGAAIYLNQAFYAQTAADQSVTLVHELLHLTYGGESDVDIAARFGLAYQVTPAGIPGMDDATVAAGRAISGWLQSDCGRRP
jgi:RHS repeat-associated protein